MDENFHPIAHNLLSGTRWCTVVPSHRHYEGKSRVASERNDETKRLKFLFVSYRYFKNEASCHGSTERSYEIDLPVQLNFNSKYDRRSSRILRNGTKHFLLSFVSYSVSRACLDFWESGRFRLKKREISLACKFHQKCVDLLINESRNATGERIDLATNGETGTRT